MMFSIVGFFLLEAQVTYSGADVIASYCQSQEIALVKSAPTAEDN